MNNMYNINKLPDFYSVRNYDQLNYALEDLEGKKCYAFFDNGFISNIIEPNKRDIRFIWDGFLLFVNQDIELLDIKNGTNLYEGRLVALQRTSLIGEKFNNQTVRNYIEKKLKNMNVPIQMMSDINKVDGYPSKCDLWSTREESILIDAIECTGNGQAYYFKNNNFEYTIRFSNSKLPDFHYKHNGAIVLKGENSTAIARLILNDNNLQEYLEKVVGEEKVFSYIEQKEIPGKSIEKIERNIRK